MSDNKRRIIECAGCHQTKPHKGRGLCDACWQRARRAHRLDDYACRTSETNFVRTALDAEQIYTIDQIVADLGYTNNPRSLARRLHREAARIEQYAKQRETRGSDFHEP
jgi:predicted amidophosphoribosyltransferase